MTARRPDRMATGGDAVTGVWYRNACRLMDLARRIERASTEAEENRLCDERDRLLSFFRRLDETMDGETSPTPKDQDTQKDHTP